MMKLMSGILTAALLVACDATEPELQMLCGASGISVTPASARLGIGDTVRVHSGPLVGQCTKEGPYSGYWQSSDANIATVDSVSGLVTARAVGKATIIITSIPNPSIAAAMVVDVVP
jgi:uncharacterized protein YjdB